MKALNQDKTTNKSVNTHNTQTEAEGALMDRWAEFLQLLPPNWLKLAQETDALRKLHKAKDPEQLLRSLMLYLSMPNPSLRGIAASLKSAGLESISYVALFKRLRKCGPFFQALCKAMLPNHIQLCNAFNDFRVKLLDGSIITEQGQDGATYRLHIAVAFPSLDCDFLKCTLTKGKGTGEGFDQYPVFPDDVFIADRNYCRLQELLHIIDGKAFFIVRYHSTNLPLYADTNGDARFDVSKFLDEMPNPLQRAEATVYLVNPHDPARKGVPCRLCGIHKTPEACEQSRRNLHHLQVRKRRCVSEFTLEINDYILVLTNMPVEVLSLEQVLNSYRFRWQVELYFKRLKTLVGLGSIPTHSEKSGTAWIYGKMLLSLILEKLHTQLGVFSPWDDIKPGISTEKLLARVKLIVEGSL